MLVVLGLIAGWWQMGNQPPPQVQPAAQPAIQPTEQPVAQTVSQPVSQPVAKPVVKSATTGVDRPTDQTLKTTANSRLAARATLISKVTLKNQDGRTIYEGPIDLQPTLDRIASGERNEHRNDGTVFQNREGQLPRKPSGYYHEYVVPTPRERGPGPQRLVLGQGGEVYYTSDHYRTFRKIAVKTTGPPN